MYCISSVQPLLDRSLEEQVVSRAHRMGARQPITVETLIMKGTAEEHIFTMAHYNHATNNTAALG
jgi:SNF2 family DNA or RNA helicase